MKSLLDSCNEGLDEHDNSDQSSTCADDEDDAGSGMQVGAYAFCSLYCHLLMCLYICIVVSPCDCKLLIVTVALSMTNNI